MPQKAEVIYLSPAADDIEEIVKYHLNQAGKAYAEKKYALMRGELAKLSDFPMMGQIHPDPLLAAERYRKLVLTKTYVAIYRIIKGNVYIYRVVNGMTDYPRLLK